MCHPNNHPSNHPRLYKPCLVILNLLRFEFITILSHNSIIHANFGCQHSTNNQLDPTEPLLPKREYLCQMKTKKMALSKRSYASLKIPSERSKEVDHLRELGI